MIKKITVIGADGYKFEGKNGDEVTGTMVKGITAEGTGIIFSSRHEESYFNVQDVDKYVPNLAEEFDLKVNVKEDGSIKYRHNI